MSYTPIPEGMPATPANLNQRLTELDNTAAAAKAAADNHAANALNPHGVTKLQVGLPNVTDHAQVRRTEMGAANGVATLGADGLIPDAQVKIAGVQTTGSAGVALASIIGKNVSVKQIAGGTGINVSAHADGHVVITNTAPESGGGGGGGFAAVRVPVLTKETGPGDTSSSATNRTNLQAALDHSTQLPVLMDVAGGFTTDMPVVMDRSYQRLMGHGRAVTTIKPTGFTGAAILVGARPDPLTSDYDGSGNLTTKRHLQKPLVGSLGNSFTLFDPAFTANTLQGDYGRQEVWPLRMSADVDLNGKTAFCLRGFWVFDATNTDTRPIIHSSGTFSRHRALDYGYGLWAQGNQLQARAKIGGVTHTLTDPTVRANGTVLHFAITYNGTTLRLFVNGTQVASAAASGVVQQEAWENVVIGPVFNTPSGDIVQYSPEGRLYSPELRDVATHTANFAAPTAAHTQDANTLFLSNGELPTNTRLQNWCVMGRDKSNGPVYLQHGKYNTPNVNVAELELTDFGIACGAAAGISGVWCEGSHPILLRRVWISDARIALWVSRNSYDALVDECLLDGHPTRGWVTCAMLWSGNFELRETTVTTGPIGIWVGGFGGTGRIHECWCFGGNMRVALIVNGNNAEHTYLSLRNFYTTDEDRSSGDPYGTFAGIIITDIDVIRGGGWGSQIVQGNATHGVGHNIPPLMLYGKVPNIRDYSSETSTDNQAVAHISVNGRVGKPILFEGRYTKKPTALPWVATAADAVYAAVSATEPA